MFRCTSATTKLSDLHPTNPKDRQPSTLIGCQAKALVHVHDQSAHSSYRPLVITPVAEGLIGLKSRASCMR